MVGRITVGSSFSGLATYLTGDPSRVEWVAARGGVSTAPQIAAAQMARIAQRGVVEKPVVHVVLSFAKDDLREGEAGAGAWGAQDRAEQFSGEVLERMGLGDAQALLVAHRDKDHRHVHVMANRFDSDRGTSWSQSYSKLRLRSAIEEVELRHGLAPTGRNARAAGLDSGPKLTRREWEAEQSGERSFPRRAAEEAGPALGKAETWQELHGQLAARGLTVERTARGGVIVGGEGERCGLSRAGRSWSMPRLEERLGPYEPARSVEQHAGARLTPDREVGEPPAREPAGREDEIPSMPYHGRSIDLDEGRPARGPASVDDDGTRGESEAYAPREYPDEDNALDVFAELRAEMERAAEAAAAAARREGHYRVLQRLKEDEGWHAKWVEAGKQMEKDFPALLAKAYVDGAQAEREYFRLVSREAERLGVAESQAAGNLARSIQDKPELLGELRTTPMTARDALHPIRYAKGRKDQAGRDAGWAGYAGQKLLKYRAKGHENSVASIQAEAGKREEAMRKDEALGRTGGPQARIRLVEGYESLTKHERQQIWATASAGERAQLRLGLAEAGRSRGENGAEALQAALEPGKKRHNDSAYGYPEQYGPSAARRGVAVDEVRTLMAQSLKHEARWAGEPSTAQSLQAALGALARDHVRVAADLAKDRDRMMGRGSGWER